MERRCAHDLIRSQPSVELVAGLTGRGLRGRRGGGKPDRFASTGSYADGNLAIEEHAAGFLPPARLVPRPSGPSDAAPMLETYGGDKQVTRFLTWRPHET